MSKAAARLELTLGRYCSTGRRRWVDFYARIADEAPSIGFASARSCVRSANRSATKSFSTSSTGWSMAAGSGLFDPGAADHKREVRAIKEMIEAAI